MTSFNELFAPFADAVGGTGLLRELIGLRRDTVARYGLFAPDAIYPVYLCDECGAQKVSLSLMPPDLRHYDSFTSFVGNVAGLVGALPLAQCTQCGRTNPAEPTWLGLFTYLAQGLSDLFLRIEHGTVADAYKIPFVGDPECVDSLLDDAAFLDAFGFPFSHRWAWRHLIDGLAGTTGFHVKRLDEGYFVGIDGSGGDDRKWQGWFAAHADVHELDGIMLLSEGRTEGFADGGPQQWLDPIRVRDFEAGRLQLTVFYSVERFRRLLEATLLQRGIRLFGSLDPFTISLDDYSCDVPLVGLIRAAAFRAHPVDRTLRCHLLGRLEFLEALHGVGRRLRENFDQQYLTSVRDGSVLEVRCPDTNDVLRSIDVSHHTDRATIPTAEFQSFLAEEFGFDTDTGEFIVPS